MSRRKFPALALVLIPLFGVSAAAGGEIAGTVTDPKGAVVVIAQVAVIDAAGKIAAAATDGEGGYELAGLAPGSYRVVVVSAGFAEARREQVGVEDERAARLDFQLQVALDAGSVIISADAKAGSGDAEIENVRK